MIIFGVRNKVLLNLENAPTFDCAFCHQKNTVKAFKSFKYFHIFWIPVFPYSKKVSTQCSHCNQWREQNMIEPVERDHILSNLPNKIPIGYYTGLLLIVLFILFVIGVGISKS